jgi:hypothetical protein
MNRALLQQALDELRNASPDTDYGDEWQNHIAAIEALRAELAKPEPEPFGYVSEHRGLIGDNSYEFHFKLETIYLNNCTSITPVYTKGTTNV